MAYFTSSIERGGAEGLNRKLGEYPSLLDFGGSNDSREYYECSYSSGVLTLPGANLTDADVGKYCLVWGIGNPSDDLAILTEMFRATTPTDSFAVVGGLDCNAAEEVRFIAKSSFISATWEVYGANSADYSDEVSASGPIVTTAEVRQDYVLASPPKRYYRIKVKSTDIGASGYASFWMAPLGRLLRTTVAAVLSPTTAALTETTGEVLYSGHVMIATDNRAQLQAFLDAASSENSLRMLHLPGRKGEFCNGVDPALTTSGYDGAYFVSDYVIYKCQHIKGDGPLSTIIRGAPGKDIFRLTDPTISEEGSLDGFIVNPCITQLRIMVDSSVDARSVNRPMFPDQGAWQTGVFYNRDAWVHNSNDDLYYCTTFVFSGPTEPTHTKGNESDGAARWTYVGKQEYVGNAAIAIPLDAPQTLDNYSLIRGYFEYIEFGSTGGIVNEFGSCGIWTQRNLYSCSLFELDFNLLTGGCIHSVPPNKHAQYPVVPDATTYDTLTFVCKYPFISFNGINCEARNLQFYTIGAIDAVSGYLLGCTAGYRYEPSGWSISNWYCEPGPWNKAQLSFIEGYGHRFTRTSFQFGSGYMYIQIDANDVVVTGVTIFNQETGPAPFLLYGNRILIQGQSFYPHNVVEDYGIGNSFEISYLFTDRAYPLVRNWTSNKPLLLPPYRSKNFDGSRILRSATCPSLSDLSFSAVEAGWFGMPIGQTPVFFTDTSLESNIYVRLKGAACYTNYANKEFMRVGPEYRYPACKGTLVFKFRGDEGTNYRHFVFSLADLEGSDSRQVGGGIDETWDATGDWEIKSFSVNLDGHEDRYISLAFSGNVDTDNLDIAWVSFVPWYTESRALDNKSERLYVGPTPFGAVGREAAHPFEPAAPTSAIFRAAPHEDQPTTAIIEVQELDTIGGNPGQVILATATMQVFANGVVKIKGTSIYAGTASPEGVLEAIPGSLFLASISSVGRIFYKATGTSSSGWVDISGLWTIVDTDNINTVFRAHIQDITNSRPVGLRIVETTHISQPATPLIGANAFEVDYRGRVKARSMGINANPSTANDGYLQVNDFLGVGSGATAPSSGELLRNTGGSRLEGTVTLPGLSAASRALTANASKQIEVSAVTATELGHLSGVTSALQTQINNLQSQITSLSGLYSSLVSAYNAHTHPPATDGPNPTV